MASSRQILEEIAPIPDQTLAHNYYVQNLAEFLSALGVYSHLECELRLGGKSHPVGAVDIVGYRKNGACRRKKLDLFEVKANWSGCNAVEAGIQLRRYRQYLAEEGNYILGMYAFFGNECLFMALPEGDKLIEVGRIPETNGHSTTKKTV